MKTEQLPAWDLTDLYQSIDDPKIEADLEKYRKFCKAFARKYKGQWGEGGGTEFAQMLKKYEKNSSVASRVGGCAGLNMVM